MTTRRQDSGELLETAIIGAGFGGLGLAIKLLQEGQGNFAVFEKSGDVGGVWRDNIYPGAACDVPSHLYSFSFEPNPEWSRTFGGQSEIHQYPAGLGEEGRSTRMTVPGNALWLRVVLGMCIRLARPYDLATDEISYA